MNQQSTQEYVEVMRQRYVKASKKQKGALLTEICEVVKCHRKSAIRLLRGSQATRKKKAGRPRRYPSQIVPPLVKVWEAADRICSQRLVAFLPELLACMERHGEMVLDEASNKMLAGISASTVDRLLRPHRQQLGRRPKGGEPSETSIKKKVPIRGYWSWSKTTVGAMQGDLVLHCGESASGFFLRTLVEVDVKTSWISLKPVWGGGAGRVVGRIDDIRRQLPFEMKSLHTDNGGEFLNNLLLPWCEEHKIELSRGRPYKKNDQAWVEQRNWQTVRRLTGSDRYDSRRSYEAMENLYRIAEMYFNFFQPTAKVMKRMVVAGKVKTLIDPAKTPYRRLEASGVLSPERAKSLEQLYRTLNPVKLRAQMLEVAEELWATARVDSGLADAVDSTASRQQAPSPSPAAGRSDV
jgi:hypothetical protein